jgi:hypothetical protein
MVNIEEVLSTADGNQILSNGLWLERLGPRGLAWKTRRITWDGFREPGAYCGFAGYLQWCIATGAACQKGTPDTCQACGAPGQPCCQGQSCFAPASCVADGVTCS